MQSVIAKAYSCSRCIRSPFGLPHFHYNPRLCHYVSIASEVYNPQTFYVLPLFLIQNTLPGGESPWQNGFKLSVV
uniref:Uncharacterized protein n=1 Tax=Anguilla anguilla TaxID=7936 RepID=A0A0E9XQL1_ANGAN